MNDILKAMKGATITFDPTRCNHMGKIISECPPCLRHRIADLESQLAESQQREGMLRAVAEAAELFRKNYYLPEDISVLALRAFAKLQNALLTAKEQGVFNGDAIGEGE